MSKTWYPVIDYTACVECGTCVNFCAYGVYNKEKSPTSVVANPAGCVEGCGCSCGDAGGACC